MISSWEIIKWLKKKRKAIVNPDDMSWEDMGFDKGAEDEVIAQFGSKEDYMEHGGDNEFDEGEQTELRLIEELKEFIEE